jgi:hypothetical protein
MFGSICFANSLPYVVYQLFVAVKFPTDSNKKVTIAISQQSLQWIFLIALSKGRKVVEINEVVGSPLYVTPIEQELNSVAHTDP